MTGSSENDNYDDNDDDSNDKMTMLSQFETVDTDNDTDANVRDNYDITDSNNNNSDNSDSRTFPSTHRHNVNKFPHHIICESGEVSSALTVLCHHLDQEEHNAERGREGR